MVQTQRFPPEPARRDKNFCCSKEYVCPAKSGLLIAINFPEGGWKRLAVNPG
jgi:hypothetical protein